MSAGRVVAAGVEGALTGALFTYAAAGVKVAEGQKVRADVHRIAAVSAFGVGLGYALFELLSQVLDNYETRAQLKNAYDVIDDKDRTIGKQRVLLVDLRRDLAHARAPAVPNQVGPTELEAAVEHAAAAIAENGGVLPREAFNPEDPTGKVLRAGFLEGKNRNY
ncbi:MAG: hypothetical protein QM723_06995 [Myxococcaceae bacterium]